jgi:maleate isomerase
MINTCAHRLGLLVPSSNTTVEMEFRDALPLAISMHVGRLPLTRIAAQSIVEIVQPLEEECRKLATADVDLILLGATAPSFVNGAGYDREVSARIEDATGTPATTTSTALLEALEEVGAKHIALGTAYDEQVNAIAAAFLEANGFEVVASVGLGYVDNLQVGRLPIETALEVGQRVDRAEADAVVLACTNWVSMNAIEPLEAELDKPVISTTQASLWACLRKLGWTCPVQGYGSLLSRHLGRARK